MPLFSQVQAQGSQATSGDETALVSEKSAGQLAIEVAKRIDVNQLFLPNDLDYTKNNEPSLDKKQSLELLRKDLQNSFFRLNALSYSKILTEYHNGISLNPTSREQSLAKLFDALEPLSKNEPISDSFDETLRVLEPYTESSDWFIAATSWHFISYINTLKEDFNAALQNANSALSIVPDELSDESTEIRIELTESLSYLYARLRNPTLTVVNASRVIDLQIAANRPVDGALHLNNMIYIFSHWRDHETTQALAEILLKNEASFSSGTPGLSQMRLALTMSEQSNFTDALKFADEGLKVVNHDGVEFSLFAVRVAALAGLGETQQAVEELSLIKIELDKRDNVSATLLSYLIYAEALIAFNSGDIQKGQKLMNKRMDRYIQLTLTRSNKASAKLIATLENSKSRQIERQDSLKREAELREAELAQKTVTNYLLLILSSLMALAAILSGVFARYRAKTATRLRIARDQARSGEKAKSEFLAIMSHELRTPLNGIIGIADLMTTQAPNEDLRHKNNIILQSGNDLLSLVESILDMSRIEAGEMEVILGQTNVRSIIEEVGDIWREKIEREKIIFTCFVDESVPDLFTTDEKRLKQCLNSLVSNAFKFTKSGRIHMHLTSMPAAVKDEMVLSIIVADTGSGIREEVIGRLFQPFVQADASITRRYGGAGLGLAITRSLARLLGGDLTVVSSAGRGSEFTLTFQGTYAQTMTPVMRPENTLVNVGTTPAPVVENPTQVVSVPLEARSTHADENTVALVPISPKPDLMPDTDRVMAGLRVLIVEDVISNQDIIKIFLKPLGCEFVTAKNGVEALQALNTHSLDVVLMDIRMPEMDGIEATRRIRRVKSKYQNIPIVALTADKTDEMRNACSDADVDLFLTKPVIAKDLISTIRFVIEHPPRQHKVQENEALEMQMSEIVASMVQKQAG